MHIYYLKANCSLYYYLWKNYGILNHWLKAWNGLSMKIFKSWFHYFVNFKPHQCKLVGFYAAGRGCFLCQYYMKKSPRNTASESGGAVLKSQTYMSTKVLSRENLRTTTPFTVFGILVPKYYSIFEANRKNTTLFWINLPFH